MRKMVLLVGTVMLWVVSGSAELREALFKAISQNIARLVDFFPSFGLAHRFEPLQRVMGWASRCVVKVKLHRNYSISNSLRGPYLFGNTLKVSQWSFCNAFICERSRAKLISRPGTKCWYTNPITLLFVDGFSKFFFPRMWRHLLRSGTLPNYTSCINYQVIARLAELHFSATFVKSKLQRLAIRKQ